MIAKVASNGTEIWSKTFGGQTECAGRTIALSPDNGFVVSGYINDTNVNTDNDFLLCKLNAQGNMLWNKTYDESESDKAYALLTTSNGYLIAGDTRSKGAGDCDAWVIKVDWNGNLLWDKPVGGENYDEAACLSSSIDGGYLVGGWTISFGNDCEISGFSNSMIQEIYFGVVQSTDAIMKKFILFAEFLQKSLFWLAGKT